MERSTRTPAKLPESTNQRLSMYALAASTAGVGVLALAQPAEAKIVYTKAHQVLPLGQEIFFLDVNHDGINDFGLLATYSFFASEWGLKAGGEGQGVAKVTEYRAIFGGAGADLGLLGALQMKIFHNGANAPQGYTLGALFGVKKEIPVDILAEGIACIVPDEEEQP
jgi:hypothetical protein